MNLKTFRLWLTGMWRAVTLQDRAAGVEIQRVYGSLDWAQKSPTTVRDLEATKINANVFIAVRAIADAIKSLSVNIVSVEVVDGKERHIDDNDHPANSLLRHPNGENTWSEIIDYAVRALLTDGNAIFTIERGVGANSVVEIYPRNPQHVEINTQDHSYRFGKYTDNQIVYPRDRVLHIREVDTTNPLWGIGRINTVREELYIDYFVNKFNANFFKHGATLNLMFTPDVNLTEDQHRELLDALNSETEGTENAFKTFVNKYAGKFEYPDQKHKDIAFGDLLKTNREKIFGVFGLPPFRGGILEYANYANALAQDNDFWQNTVRPILKVIVDAFNKQLLWKIYGEDISLEFDLNEVPAIRGDKNKQVERVVALYTAGVVSGEWARKELNIEESAAPQNANEEGTIPPTFSNSNRDKLINALHKILKHQQFATVSSNLQTMTASGTFMSVLCDAASQVERLFPKAAMLKILRNQFLPLFNSTVLMSVTDNTLIVSNANFEKIFSIVADKLELVIDDTAALLKITVSEAIRHQWTYWQLVRVLKRQFTRERACLIVTDLLSVTADYLNKTAIDVAIPYTINKKGV